MAPALQAPLVCLVTDRRRLPEPGEQSLVRLAGAAAAAGVDVIQIRERDLDDRRLLHLIRRVLDITAGTDATVVVNERTDLALAAGAHGVHLRADSAAARRVRAMAPEGFTIGRSVHSAAEATEEGPGADYLIMGTVFPTSSKSSAMPAVGIAGLRDACSHTALPVLAIGGVTVDRLQSIASSGAAGVAAIGLFSDMVAAGLDAPLETTISALVGDIRRVWARATPRACARQA